MNHSRARLLVVLGLAVAGCTGVIGGKGEGSGPGPGPVDITGPRTETLCATPATPRPVYLRRLTNAEYSRTVSDILGVTVDAETQFRFPSDTAAGGFRNNAENGTIATTHVQHYGDAAARLVSDLLASATRRTALVGCDMATATDRAGCLDAFLKRVGRRIYRRPLRADEVTGLTVLAGTVGTTDPWAGAGTALEAMLQSSDFLYRVELGQPDTSHPGAVKLGGFELATRLSYLLWGTAPDDALLDRAAAGALDTIDGVTGQARQMLADARGRKAMQDFYLQWLQVENLDNVAPSPAMFPKWNDTLRASMREETVRVADDLIWRDGASFLDLLAGKKTFVDATLASLYGLPAPAAGTWQQVDAGPARGGFLTQASFLTVTSRPERTSPTIRGRFVRQALLCQKLPDPPADVNTTLPMTAGLSLRDRLEEHAKNPACANCHTYMDPVGLGFEQYDAIGAFHATDAAGQPISAAGKLNGYDNPDFDGPGELAQHILDTTAFPRCAAVHMFRYAFARRETADDQCTTDRFFISFRDSGYSVREMLASIVSSDAFRYRLNATADNGGSR